MFPIVSFESFPVAEANQLLKAWGHKMGPMNRPMGLAQAHVLLLHGEPVSCVMTADLVRERVGGVDFLDRSNSIELARVCSKERDWNRVAVRLWRKAIFPSFGKRFAVSYQDANLHNGDLYRFDGWKKVGFSRSGTDKRSGRKGRAKYIWVYSEGGFNHENNHPATTGLLVR